MRQISGILLRAADPAIGQPFPALLQANARNRQRNSMWSMCKEMVP